MVLAVRRQPPSMRIYATVIAEPARKKMVRREKLLRGVFLVEGDARRVKLRGCGGSLREY